MQGLNANGVVVTDGLGTNIKRAKVNTEMVIKQEIHSAVLVF